MKLEGEPNYFFSLSLSVTLLESYKKETQCISYGILFDQYYRWLSQLPHCFVRYRLKSISPTVTTLKIHSRVKYLCIISRTYIVDIGDTVEARMIAVMGFRSGIKLWLSVVNINV